MEVLTDFLMWCSIINGSFLVIGSIFLFVRPSFVFQIHSKFVSLTENQIEVFFYGFIGAFKVLFLVFNLVPFIALKIVS